MKKYSILIFYLVQCMAIYAQPVFISAAEIEFERKVNIWAGLEGVEFSDQLKESTPQFKSDYFNFSFKDKISVYKPGRSNSYKQGLFGTQPADRNEVFTDFDSGYFVAQKSIFENTYLVEDRLRNTTWKITNDFREIAGFNCRRATTIIMDSVFVVAFYTDEITIPGGPESINGLPGMILGLVINRLHTTWYATKVKVEGISDLKLVPPTRGIQTTDRKLLETISGSFETWGKEAAMAIWKIMI